MESADLSAQFSEYDVLKQALETLPFRDRARLKASFEGVARRLQQGQPVDRKLARLHDVLAPLIEQQRRRQQSIPDIHFPEALPVSERRDDILTLLQTQQVIVLAGETGSGKTTQIPKLCLAAGLGLRGGIAHTQPRRIAARTVAARIADELGVELGGLVGYQVRFTDHSSDATLIKLMTDGVLLAEIQHDPLLLKYEVIIIDEAHERSLNIDFLLGYLKQLLPKRPELKLIITSATIDVQRFSEHFANAPMIEVSGRTYPVEIRYRPWHDEGESLSDAVIACLEEIQTEPGPRGDVLVFLSGEREIRELSHALRRAQLRDLDVLPLYARLTLAEQNRIFQPHRGQRVVLATNVAETSITVPGIRWVIDTGLARISRYSLRTKVQRLPIEAISQASANQRAGRCGRVSAGICYRLYSEEDFAGRPLFTEPEILRTNLAAVVLQMLQLNLGKVEDFPFVEKPERRQVSDGYALLEELKAVDKQGKITAIGRELHTLSLDPRLARMLLEAAKHACLAEVLIIVCGLTIADPRERPADKQQQADEKHRRFADEESDFVAYVKLWDYVETQRQELSQNQWRKQCEREFLNVQRLREWRELHSQIKSQLKEIGLRLNTESAGNDAIHRALLVGLLSNIGLFNDKNKDSGKERKPDYLGTRNKQFSIFPGSFLRKKKYRWIMAADYIETAQIFAHCVAKIDPAWVIELGAHLINKQYLEPHYDVKSGSVKAKVVKRLWGLVLSENSREDFSRVDPVLAREIFIRSALVEGLYRGKGDFFGANQGLLEAVHDLEAKSRRRDILVDDEALMAFYQQRVPSDIVNLAGFEHWRKRAERENSTLLVMTHSDVMRHDASHISAQLFPDQIRNGELILPVRYIFEPAGTNDGMNVQVPIVLLHQINAESLEWLVPGMLKEKCIAMMKTLPKLQRKYLVPVPDFADKALLHMKNREGSLSEALALALTQLSSTDIQAGDFQLDKIDAYYFANVQLLDDHGKLVEQSRELAALRARYKERVQLTLQDIGNDIEREHIQSWDFGRLPESVDLKRSGVSIKAYPALVADKKSTTVAIALRDSPQEAAAQTLVGQCKLALSELKETARNLKKELLRGKDIGLTLVNLGSRDEVVEDLLLAAIRRACFGDFHVVRSEEEFQACLQHGRAQVAGFAREYETLLLACLERVLAIKKMIKSSKNALALALAFGDVQAQLQQLLFPGFMLATAWSWLQHLPRYLDAIVLRLEKAPQKPHVDRQNTDSLASLWQLHQQRLQERGLAEYALNEEWQNFRWLLEELRVSLFAQTLKTLMPVSEKRLKKQWQNLS